MKKLLILVSCLLLAPVGCSQPATEPTPRGEQGPAGQAGKAGGPAGEAPGQDGTAEGLKAFCEHLHQTIFVKNDPAQGAALFRSLMPDEQRLRKALRDDIDPAALKAIQDFHRKLGVPAEAEAHKLASPKQTRVHVVAATTEELIAAKKDSTAFLRFPGGARKVAGRVLRPGVTFYEVHFLEPGKAAGMRYHLFYWDGRQWTMLGPIWRNLS